MKKGIIPLLLLLMLILPVIPVMGITDSAEYNSASVESTAIITVDETWGNPGDIVDVNLNLIENPGILGATLTVSWDESLTLISDASGEAFAHMTYAAPSRYISTGTNFVWFGNEVDVPTDGIALTLSFKISENTENNEILPIRVTYTNGDVIDADDNDVLLTITNGSIRVITYLPGDVTGDGRVNARDLVRLSQYVSDGCKTDPEGYNAQVVVDACDVTEDGRINARDLIKLSQYISDGSQTNPDGYNAVLKPAKLPQCTHPNLVAMAAKAPTCTEDGNIAYWECISCNKYYSDAEAKYEITLASTMVDAIGHKYAAEWSYDSQYHWHASACGHSSEIKDYSEHTFVDGKCSTCDAPEISSQQFTVTFVDFDNSIIDIQLVDYGSNATKPSDPNRKNYKFIGWDTTFTNVATDLTVKAQYIRQYTVTFVDYDGTVISTDIVDSGDNATPPSHPLREGYTFASWNQSYNNIVADIEIMAVYEINRYTVTFLDADGSVISSITNVAHGTTVTPPKTADMYFDWSKTKGYRFTGWKDWDASQPIVGNISITAEYSEEITDPIMAIETKEIPKGTTTAEVSVYLCGSFENIYGMSLKLQYAEQLALSNGSIIINSNLKDSESTLNADNHQYELSWADGNGLNISERLEALTLTFKIDKYTEVGEYLVKLLEGTYIIDADLSKITPIIIVGHVIITK